MGINIASWTDKLYRREKIKGEEIYGEAKKKSHGQLTHARAHTHTHTPASTRQWLPRDHVQHGRPRTTTTIISELSHEFSPCRNRVYGHLCSATNVAVAAAVAALDRAIDDAVVFHFVNIIIITMIAVVFLLFFFFACGENFTSHFGPSSYYNISNRPSPPTCSSRNASRRDSAVIIRRCHNNTIYNRYIVTS